MKRLRLVIAVMAFTTILAIVAAIIMWLGVGRTPSRPPSEGRVSTGRYALGAACNFSQPQGRWVQRDTLEVNGIHAAMMPNGLVLVFGYNDTEHFYDEETGFQLWDPNPDRRVSVGPKQSFKNFNPFCAGQCFLGDDRLFVAGGYKSSDPFRASAADQVRAVRADGNAVVWEPGFHKMDNIRWYPTVVTLANGNAFIIGGSSPFAANNWNNTVEDVEFFDVSQNRLIRHDETRLSLPEDGAFPYPPGDQRQVNADGRRLAGLYPLAHLLPNVPGDDAPNGLLFVLTESFVRIYNPSTNSIIGAKQDVGGFRTWWTQASSVLLPIDIDSSGGGPSQVRVMVLGGGTLGKGGSDGAQARALNKGDIWVYDVGSRTITRDQSVTLHRDRFMGDSILLPNGKIVLVGGASMGYTNNNSGRIVTPELITPPSSSSSPGDLVADLADATERRGYHASALLLPDGSVFVTGGTGGWANEGLSSYPPEEHKTVEIFEPPYLSLGPRPRILQAPTVLGVGDPIEITTDRSDVRDEIVLIRHGARTHSLDTDQRMLRLEAHRHTNSDGSITLTAHMPNNATLVPPGPYLLWVLRTCSPGALGDAVPSVARLVSVRLPGASAAVPPRASPLITIRSPFSGIRQPVDRMIEFQATAVNGRGRNISSMIHWSSDRGQDGPFPRTDSYFVVNDGAHPTLYLPPGDRLITATVADPANPQFMATDQVAVTVTDVPVTVEIVQPDRGSNVLHNHFFPDDFIELVGHSHYLEGQPLPADHVRWFLDTPTNPLNNLIGPGPFFVRASTLCLSPPCRHTIIFSGWNDPSMPVWASVDIYIDPGGHPPQVSIRSPSNGATVPGQFVGCFNPPQREAIPIPTFRAAFTLQGRATDQHGVAIPDSNLTWNQSTADGPIIGTGATVNAVLVENQLSSHPTASIPVQIYFVAQDSGGMSSASITISITTSAHACP